MLSRRLGKLCLTSWSRLHNASPLRCSQYSTAKSAVLQQLDDVTEMMSRVDKENSPIRKTEIISQYPQLRPLLEQVYEPSTRLHMTSATLRGWILNEPPPIDEGLEIPSSLLGLFELLSSRSVTGNAAKDTVKVFLSRNGVAPEETQRAFDTFSKLLDRNLAVGFGSRTLMSVPWPESVVPSASYSSSSKSPDALSSDPSRPTSASTPTEDPPRRKLKAFSCALGRTIQPPFDELRKEGPWYASRKLDGVRVLAFLDFHVPDDQTETPILLDTTFVSRNGKPFKSLDKLASQLHDLDEYPKLREILERDPVQMEETKDGRIKRLVLDGEVCHMIPSSSAPTARTGDDGAGANALWKDDGYVEDFHGTVSAIMRHENMEHPAYFVFDMLPWIEVDEGKYQSGPGLGKTFSERSAELKDMLGWLQDNAAERRRILQMETTIRALIQSPVELEDVDAMVERAAAEGWEGLVFRADKPYEGRRTKDILKFKKWQDAEYEVLDVETNHVRLGVNGEYDVYNAAVSLIIEHKGHRVAVGSGFTADERIRWGADPSSIIGKTITVEYFSESKAADRSEGLSLRFPRLKTVWDGPRDI